MRSALLLLLLVALAAAEKKRWSPARGANDQVTDQVVPMTKEEMLSQGDVGSRASGDAVSSERGSGMGPPGNKWSKKNCDEIVLCLHADSGDLDAFHAALKKRTFRAPLDLQDAHGMSALHAAARSGHQEVVEALLQAGARTDLRTKAGETAADFAEMSGHVELAELITHLEEAKAAGSEGKEMPDGEGEGEEPKEEGEEMPDGDTQRLDKSAASRHEELRRQIDDEAAAGHPHPHEELRRRRLLVKADDEGSTDTETGKAYQHSHKLVRAADHGNLPVVLELLEQGVGADEKDEQGASALMAASWRGHTRVVQALLAAKADANMQSKQGETALMVAAFHGQTAVVTALLEAGANPHLRTKALATAQDGSEVEHEHAGKTARQVAQSAEVKALLQTWEEKIGKEL